MYNPTNGHMCFAEALAYIKRKQPMARAAWITGNYIQLNDQAITFFTPVAKFPWAPSSDDVLAEDWAYIIPTSTQQGTLL